MIGADRMWANYEYFIKAVIPYAEKYGVNLALHPDDTLGRLFATGYLKGIPEANRGI